MNQPFRWSNAESVQPADAAAPVPASADSPVAGAPPPSVRRPVQAQQVSYTSSWLHFLIVLCLLIAWWFPAKLFLSRVLWPHVKPTGPRDSQAFVAIAYEGVSDKPGEVRPAQFREHLDALKKAGYMPITLKDVEGLVRDGKPVPRRAILLTFDHARKTSYFNVHSMLRRAGWNAVMFLWTKPVADRDSAALLWPYVRNMIRSGVWEIGAQSHDGFDRIPASPKGTPGNFMTSPKWLESEKRFESLEEFERRLTEDHVRCIAEIEKGLGVRPEAYAYPFGDFGQFQHRAIVTRPANLALAEKNYKLAFICGNLALNTKHSDSRRLNRLLVRSAWTGKDLVEYLDRSWPVESPQIAMNQGMVPTAWIVDWGSMSREDDSSLTLYAPTNTTGAKMWLAGSDLNKDFYTKVRFQLDRGQFGLNFRASADGESYVYLGIDAGGEIWLRQMQRGREMPDLPAGATEDAGVWLRQKQVGTERFTVASSYYPIDPNVEHTLEVYLRDKLLFAHLDGKEIFRRRSVLRGEQKPGMFGLSVWAPMKGSARVRLTGVNIHEQNPTMASWPVEPKFEPYVFRWIDQNAFRLTQISPAWMRAGIQNAQGAEASMDMDLYRMLARVNHLQLMPQVIVDEEAALSRLSPSLLADKAAAIKADGLFVNLSSMRAAAMPTIATWMRQVGSALQDKGLKLLLRMPEAMETRSTLQSVLAVVPNARVVVDTKSPLKDDPTLKQAQSVAVEAVPKPDGEEDLPLFYMIQPTGTTPGAETQEAKGNRLQQEGLAAYLDGQFEKAAQYWKEWLQIEPDNAKALMLVGDAMVRLGDLKGAVRYYDRSLDIDPGQIALALRRVDLYTAMGDQAKAIASLNLYARLFPENVDILLAQGSWLDENGRREEALGVARKVLKVAPDSVQALTVVMRLTTTEKEYADTMKRLVEVGAKSDKHLELGQAMWKHELTALPHAESLVALARDIASRTKDPRVAEVFSRLAPRQDKVVETFADGRISNQWWLDGGRCEGKGGGSVRLSSGETYSEATLRLLGSLHLHNTFVETTISDATGSFWLFTGRTSDHLARFGFSDTGYIHLQTWRKGRLVGERKIEWQKPEGKFKLRMEANGDGIMGYVDGKPMFSARLYLPEDLSLGWIGVAVHSSTRGRAAATIHTLSGGPASARLAILGPVSSDAEADAQLTQARPDVFMLTALCPAWYEVGNDGRWKVGFTSDKQIYHVFARYHRVWMVPFVEVQQGADIRPEDVEARGAEINADGFLLVFKEWPGDEWFASFRDRMRNSKLRILIGVVDSKDGVAHLRPAGRGFEFTGGREDPVDLRITPRASLGDMASTLDDGKPIMIGY